MDAQHLFTMVIAASGIVLMLVVFFYALGHVLHAEAEGGYHVMLWIAFCAIVFIQWIYGSTAAARVIHPEDMLCFSVVYYLLLYVVHRIVRHYLQERSKGAEIDRIRHKAGYGPLPHKKGGEAACSGSG